HQADIKRTTSGQQTKKVPISTLDTASYVLIYNKLNISKKRKNGDFGAKTQLFGRRHRTNCDLLKNYKKKLST
ncbi:MAG: hypothetical protein II661_10420, partial [Bacteroidales bacterium]|nr:hypothetical protein [Bacteroidales bacterium]